MTVLSSEGTDCLTNELLKAFCLHNCKCLLEESIGNLNELQETKLQLLFVWDFFWFSVQHLTLSSKIVVPSSVSL